MKKIFKILVSVIMAFALALPSTVSFAGLGADSATTVNIIKLASEDELEESKTVLQDFYEENGLGTTEWTPKQIADKYYEEKKVTLKPLKGAKFYVFRVGDKATFDKLNKSKDKYDTVEKIFDEVNSDENLKIYSSSSENNKQLINPKKLDGATPVLMEELVGEEIKSKDNITACGTTDKDGKLTLKLKDFYPEADEEADFRSNRSFYWIVEDQAGNEDEAKDVSQSYAVPIALTLPMAEKYHSDGKFISGQSNVDPNHKLDEIYVYPKNTIGKKVTKEKTVESERIKYTSIDNYQDISWYLQGNIPSNDFKKLTYLKFEDTVEPIVATYDDSEENKYLGMSGEQLKDIKDKGFVFLNDDNNPVEVYVKKTHPTSKEEAAKKVTIPEDYYTATYSKDGKSVNVEFNTEKVGDETVLKINKDEDHPIFKTGGFKEADELTVYVKLKARYANKDMNETNLGTYKDKEYNEADAFNKDVENEKNEKITGITGIGDKDLNKLRINDFKLKYSHNSKFEKDKTTPNEAEGNKYEPRVDTGGKKFIKYHSNDNTKLEGLEDAKFYVKRERTVTILDDRTEESKKIKEEIEAVGEEYYGIKKNTSGFKEYLALKGNRKIWIPENYLKPKKDNGENLELELNEEGNKKYEGAKLYSLESGTNGLFELRGLEMSDYTAKILVYEGKDKTPKEINYATINNQYSLVEYAAPEGYQIDKNDIGFSIKKGSHVEEDKKFTLKLDDMAKKADYETIIDDEKKTTILDQSMAIENVKPKIPSTGGIGRLIFIIIGLIIMAVSAILYKKRKCEA